MQIILTVDRLEGKQVILKTKDGETIEWPKNKLPENTKEGDVLNFEINDDNQEKNKQQKTAQNILKEILETNE